MMQMEPVGLTAATTTLNGGAASAHVRDDDYRQRILKSEYPARDFVCWWWLRVCVDCVRECHLVPCGPHSPNNQ